MTPGAVDVRITHANIASTICVPGYARSVRPPYAVTRQMKRAAMIRSGHYGERYSSYEFDHLVPLSVSVVELLTSQFPTKAKRTGPVFSTDGHKPINGFSKPKAKLDAAIAKVLADDAPGELPMVQPWVFHDLRRTFQTNAQALGFPRDNIHAAVNHAAEGRRSGLARIYQLYDYQTEKAALMGAWARRVGSIIDREDKSNVVTMLRAN